MDATNWIAFGTLLIAALSTIAALRKGKRSDVKADQEDLLVRVRRLEVKTRVLDDYCNQLRGKISAAGIDVPPWPEELTEGGV